MRKNEWWRETPVNASENRKADELAALDGIE
jgi:hypothetical protein